VITVLPEIKTNAQPEVCMSGALFLVIALLALPFLVALAVLVDRRSRRQVRQPVGWWTPPPPRRHARIRR
jgi:hypothetical protein